MASPNFKLWLRPGSEIPSNIVFFRVARAAERFEVLVSIVVAILVLVMHDETPNRTAAFAGRLAFSPICLDATLPAWILRFSLIKVASYLIVTGTRTVLSRFQPARWNPERFSTQFAAEPVILAIPSSHGSFCCATS
jgi:hypothetical protein